MQNQISWFIFFYLLQCLHSPAYNIYQHREAWTQDRNEKNLQYQRARFQELALPCLMLGQNKTNKQKNINKQKKPHTHTKGRANAAYVTFTLFFLHSAIPQGTQFASVCQTIVL